MPVLHPITRLLLHLRQYVPDNLGVFLSLWSAYYGNERELWPCQRVVEVVFEEVVFGQVSDVACLNGRQEGDVRGVGGDGYDVDHRRGEYGEIER